MSDLIYEDEDLMSKDTKRTFGLLTAVIKFNSVNLHTNIVCVCFFFLSLLSRTTDGPLPSVLQEVSVPVINNTICENMYRNAGYIEHIPHIFICAGWRKGGYDSCEGNN